MGRILLIALALLMLPTVGRAGSLVGTVHWSGSVQIDETVRVEPGAELILAPGTRVNFRGGRLEVAGRLVAEQAVFDGDWEGVMLKGCDGTTILRNCRISGARTGIMAIGGSPRLEELELRDNEVGMELRQKCAARVSGCRFEGNRKVGLFIKDEAVPEVEENLFRSNGKFGAYIFRANPAAFRKNRFEMNATGLMVANFGSDPRVEGNRFEGNTIGILVDRAARPQLVSNVLTGNDTGIRLYRRSDPEVVGNRLKGNRIAVSLAYSCYPQLHDNDFSANATALLLEYQSSRWEAEKGSAARAAEVAGRGAFGQAPRGEVSEEQRRARTLDGVVDARNNWWGVAGTAELQRLASDGNPTFIQDGRDTPTFTEGGKDYPLDLVRFAPWRSAPATEQP
ncbi:hypothetical protein JCM30471_16380 [Desulfuromonas carbonis]|uniref:right-handed parallel beta-helix repeat-containing protein n=1 Tax=Desulfuromonas sp. DDH964 TaxID=1823759 RepID=UPI00078C3531|nr:right-handed parallel beta-helix repeat-containing protein [Desulfuromonas sp. DDH964]AMV73235.1 hypothetical protein DBW_2926 [Desulfuromonas sp. DDH964]